MKKEANSLSEAKTVALPVCGIVMPISETDGCPKQHWLDVRDILSDASATVGFEARMVSEADEVGVIQKRIIQNLYENPVVVCDVSGRNPNVMFELGMRLAFDKPCVVVKDDKTAYSFDPSPIEHLEYPRDLRFNRIVEFKEELSEKITATCGKATTDPDYSSFLKHFGTFVVAKLETKTVPKEEFILEELKGIRAALTLLAQQQGQAARPASASTAPRLATAKRTLCLGVVDEQKLAEVLATLTSAGVTGLLGTLHSNKHYHISLTQLPGEERARCLALASQHVPGAKLM